MKQSLRWYDYITINIFYLGLSSLNQTMTPLVIPLLVQQFVGEELKGSYYGTLRLWTLMIALLVQSVIGMLSDSSNFKLGKRRPFIFLGTMGIVAVLILVGFSAELEGTYGFWILFALIILQNIASNTAQGAQQGLMPDLVPQEKRGLSSGIKAIFEVPLPIVLVSLTIAKLVSDGKLWEGLALLISIVLTTMIITMFVPEKQHEILKDKINWKPFGRLALMTVVFTITILLVGEFLKFVTGLIPTDNHILFISAISLAGSAAMGLAIIAGVIASTRVGIGKDAAKNKPFVWWVINRLAFLVSATGLASFFVYFLQGRFGFQAQEAIKPAANLSMIIGVFILISAIPSGWLSDRFGRKLIVGFSGFLAAAGTLLIIVSNQMTLLYISCAIIGIGIGFFYSANWALGTEIVPKDEAGRYLGISNLAGAGAGAIGAYIGGPIADAVNSLSAQSSNYGFVALYIIYAILFVVSIFTLKGISTNQTFASK